MATSITNTSISTDTINVDNGVLYVDNNNNRVGVGTASPTASLHVAGITTLFDSDTYGILELRVDNNDDQTNNDGIIKISTGSASLTKAELRYDESEDLVHLSYGDHGRNISINSSGNVGIGTGSSNPTAKLDVVGQVRAQSFNGVSTGTRNLLINGDMQIAQRSTDVTLTSNSYQYQAIDRWGNYYSTNRVISTYADVPGTWGGTAYKNVMKIIQGSTIQNLYTFQWVEELGWMLRYNTPFSVSFKARANRSGQIAVQMRYGDFGAGSSSVSDTLGYADITTSWQTIKYENITHNRSYRHAGLWLWGDSISFTSTGDWIEITDVQLELGPVATPYEQKTRGMEFLACQRYYQKLEALHQSGSASSDHGIFMGHVWGSTNIYWVHQLNVPMRSGPVLKLGQAASSTGIWYSGGSTATTTSSFGIQSANENRVELACGLSGSLVQGNGAWMRLQSSGHWVAFDAEHI